LLIVEKDQDKQSPDSFTRQSEIIESPSSANESSKVIVIMRIFCFCISLIQIVALSVVKMYTFGL
jgi:hypothetical protein